jgi:hypothetical protein
VKEFEDENRRLRMENESLKSGRFLRADAPVAERCAVIDVEKANYKISWMCAAGRSAVVVLCLASPRLPGPGWTTGTSGTLKQLLNIFDLPPEGRGTDWDEQLSYSWPRPPS